MGIINFVLEDHWKYIIIAVAAILVFYSLFYNQIKFIDFNEADSFSIPFRMAIIIAGIFLFLVVMFGKR